MIATPSGSPEKRCEAVGADQIEGEAGVGPFAQGRKPILQQCWRAEQFGSAKNGEQV
jgi:hypothetical protein